MTKCQLIAYYSLAINLRELLEINISCSALQHINTSNLIDFSVYTNTLKGEKNGKSAVSKFVETGKKSGD